MDLRPSRFGLFYSCPRGCDVKVGAHPDGRPKGIPADKETRQARISAHAAFDRLWNEGPLTRSGAYRWLQERLSMTSEEAHIGQFTTEQCTTLIPLVQEYLNAQART